MIIVIFKMEMIEFQLIKIKIKTRIVKVMKKIAKMINILI
jgi:hypothetical protein